MVPEPLKVGSSRSLDGELGGERARRGGAIGMGDDEPAEAGRSELLEPRSSLGGVRGRVLRGGGRGRFELEPEAVVRAGASSVGDGTLGVDG